MSRLRMQGIGPLDTEASVDFGPVERNLRAMFSHLAAGRVRGEVRELHGLTIASAGSTFQMFNAAFFNAPVLDLNDLDRRIALAQVAFAARGLSWSLWVCEQWVPEPFRRRLARSCERAGLYLGSEMPAMASAGLPDRPVPGSALEIRQVCTVTQIDEFCRIGASCFRVPLPWFQEIFDSPPRLTGTMNAWLGYHEGSAVATVAIVRSPDATGVYNLATLTPFRERGFGEAMLRFAIRQSVPATGPKPLVLQSTKQGLKLYERLGFRPVGRILVFPSR